jgi:hypothetical protein
MKLRAVAVDRDGAVRGLHERDEAVDGGSPELARTCLDAEVDAGCDADAAAQERRQVEGGVTKMEDLGYVEVL